MSPNWQKEEKELVKNIQQGDEKAKDVLFKRYVSIIKNVAQEYTNKDPLPELDTLVKVGKMGLMNAIVNFKEEEGKGEPFMAYSIWWVKRAIETHFEKHEKSK